MRVLGIVIMAAAILCFVQVHLEQPAFARAHRHVDCSDQHWMALLEKDDLLADNDHAGKVHAMTTAADTRAACLTNAGDGYASMVDDAANQYDSAGDQALLMGEERYSCFLHTRALRLENDALARHLNVPDLRLVMGRRADTLRSMRFCH